jgi:hypothetical protein
MPPMRATRIAPALACPLLAGALIAGCGGGSDSTGSTSTSAETGQSHPAPARSEFPSPEGRSLEDLIKSTDGHSELVISPAAMVFYKGANRYPFGVFEHQRVGVPDAEVALYLAKVPAPKSASKTEAGGKGPVAQAEAQALEEPALGPFPASIETLATKPAFQARTTVEDPNAASVVYSTTIEFPSNGEWRIAALIREEGEIKATILPSAIVGEFSSIPRPGQKAPLIHTPTAAEVGGDLSKITTRIPPDAQNKVDYADVLGKEPIVLLFATPQFCQSRVCGPVVDVAEQAKHELGDKAAFIHMEIYKDNDPSKGVRPQVLAFHLPSEPWLFTINRHGDVSSVIEGAFGLHALTRAVDEAAAE